MNLNNIIKLARRFEKQARTDKPSMSLIKNILGDVDVKLIGEASVDTGDLVVADPIYMDRDDLIVRLRTGGDGGYRVYELSKDGTIEGYFVESHWPVDSK